MKIIRHILSHAILLVFLVALAFAYAYRAQLFSTGINARIDNTVNSLMQLAGRATDTDDKQGQPVYSWAKPVQSEPTQSGPTQSKADQQAQQDVAEEATVTDRADVQAEQPLTSEASTDKGTAKTTETSGTTDDTTAVNSDQQQAQTDQASAAQPAAQETTKMQTDASDKPAEAPSKLDEARLAFQNGKPDQSIALYQQLLETNHEDPNLPGEMGNVYYAQGKWQQAGKAYYEAATRLLKQGNTQQVHYLYRVIQGLDKQSAEKLRRQMNIPSGS